MRVVGRESLELFCQAHPDARTQADAWLCEVEEANWQTPHELKARFPNASLLGNNRVVFNLRGNRYRLLATISYKNQVLLIERVGTHEEYDQWEL